MENVWKEEAEGIAATLSEALEGHDAYASATSARICGRWIAWLYVADAKERTFMKTLECSAIAATEESAWKDMLKRFAEKRKINVVAEKQGWKMIVPTAETAAELELKLAAGGGIV